MNTSMLNKERESPEDISWLETHAREAYEQKRIKECVALTKQLLLVDPQNVEAEALQSAIQLGIQRDLNDARALLEDSQKKEDGQKYRKAAEIILLKTLNIDPAHGGAKALLAVTKAAAAASSPTLVAAKPAAPPARPAPSPTRDEIPFTAGYVPVDKEKEQKQSGSILKLPVVLVVVVIVAGGLLLLVQSSRTSRAAVPEPVAAAVPAERQPDNAVLTPVPSTDPLPAANSASAGVNSVDAGSVVAPIPVPIPPKIKPTVTPETGALAVSSPTPADIYMGDKFLGSIPTTLQLPIGPQTLEYRHGDLRTVRTHDVKSKETTTALITFEVVVQINARPWAQVFVEGVTRRPLGQTPLSSVRVPIGSVLVFENPNFPTKTHRVNEKDTTVLIAFP